MSFVSFFAMDNYTYEETQLVMAETILPTTVFNGVICTCYRFALNGKCTQHSYIKIKN